jgi:hypothetical protein
MDNRYKDPLVSKTFEIIRDGIENERILSKEDALLVIHVAYFADLPRILRKLSGIQSLTRALNIAYAISELTNPFLVSQNRDFLKSELFNDVLVNRTDLEKDLASLKPHWIKDETLKRIQGKAKIERIVRKTLQSPQEFMFKDESPPNDPSWVLSIEPGKVSCSGVEKYEDGKPLTIYEYAPFECRGRTCAFGPFEHDNTVVFKSFSLDEFIRKCSNVFSLENLWKIVISYD